MAVKKAAKKAAKKAPKKAAKKTTSNQGRSAKAAKPKEGVTHAAGQEQEQRSGTTRSIGIGMPVDEKTMRELKEKARKL